MPTTRSKNKRPPPSSSNSQKKKKRSKKGRKKEKAIEEEEQDIQTCNGVRYITSELSNYVAFDKGLWWVCLGIEPDTDNNQWVEVERTDERVINFLRNPEDNHGSEAAIAYRHGFDSEMNTNDGDNNNNSEYDSETDSICVF